MRLRPTPSVFAALAQAIAYQQLNGKAAAAIFARVCALFPDGAPTPEPMLRMTEEQLRGAGLSRTVLSSYLPAFFTSGALCLIAAGLIITASQIGSPVLTPLAFIS